MDQQAIKPEKITRPFQLLAAWLTGLTVVNGSFLLAASQVKTPDWAPAALVVAAIANVPIFLFSIFLLQTKFRPEMQEDIYYSKYLEYQRATNVLRLQLPEPSKRVQLLSENIAKEVSASKQVRTERIRKILQAGQVEAIEERIGGRRALAELFLFKNEWPKLVNMFQQDPKFQEDINVLLNEGVIRMDGEDYKSVDLTEIGQEVAFLAQKRNHLWSQQKKVVRAPLAELEARREKLKAKETVAS